MTPEFDLIAKYFHRIPRRARLGIGDDCALIDVTSDQELAISTDTLVAGTHFFADADAEKLGHKALAVNLSDLAAMGAKPCYVTLAITLPAIDHAWLGAFSKGFFALAGEHGVELIGGDTTRGPLSMTLTVLGEIAKGKALRRDVAKAGDDIWVTGSLGGAAVALQHMLGTIALPGKVFSAVEDRLHRPMPRNAIGMALIGIANAAIDVSDGLLADLGHICERSNLMASIERSRVPMSAGLLSVRADLRDACVFAGGDDYELCFTASASRRGDIDRLAATQDVAITRIGTMAESGTTSQHSRTDWVRVVDQNGVAIEMPATGFDHFSKPPAALQGNVE
jgi:thiamine-monophosphate kinase